jgi:hypothetical protein
MAPGDNVLPEICKIKHDNIDKDVAGIKNDIEEIKKDERDQHEEIKDMIEKLSRDVLASHVNLKNKIILVNRSLGDKIDELNDFDKELRGNGDPGVWETVRANKESIRVTRKIGYWFIGPIIGALVVLFIIALGGEWNGLGKKEDAEVVSPKIQQVVPAPVVEELPKIVAKPKEEKTIKLKDDEIEPKEKIEKKK